MSTITVESADVPLLEMSMSLILFELISQAIYIYDVAQSTTSDLNGHCLCMEWHW